MRERRVVVTGLGALTPIGNDVPTFWESLVNGVSGAGPITHFDTSKHKTQFACEVKNFNPQDHFDRKEIRLHDIVSLYAMVAARQAVADANIDTEAEDLNKIGVIMGVGIGGLGTFEKELEEFDKGDGTPRFSPFLIPKMIVDSSSGHISMEFGFRGPNYACVSACATSTSAISSAFDQIKLGRANIMITGGVISVGAMLSGLLVNAGIGVALLFRNNRPIKDSFRIVGILLLVGVLSGFLLDISPLAKFFTL